MYRLFKTNFRKILLLIIILPILILFSFSMKDRNEKNNLSTNWIQKAIDSCAAAGGGTVRLMEGIHISGSLELKSKVTLQLDKGAILQGSDNYADYQNDAFIFGKDLTDISIIGEGTIDGVDCYNPKGEEGFRGPHCIRLIKCKNITIKGITIKNSANWAINCRYCSFATIENVTIRAGHDGLHTRFCDHFTAKNCDFRTGDDAFAGNDNQDFHISGCKLNSSCNIFRLGCLDLEIEDCKIWGPGEYMHRIRKVAKLPTVFTHFSPDDENTKLISGNWIVRNLIVDGAEHFYMYNFENGLWQTGQPATNISFDNIKVTNLLHGFNIIGDKKRKFELDIKNSSFIFSDSTILDTFEFENVKFNSPAFINAQNFNKVSLKDVEYNRKSSNPILICKNGNKLNISNVKNLGGVELNPNKIDKVLDYKPNN